MFSSKEFFVPCTVCIDGYSSSRWGDAPRGHKQSLLLISLHLPWFHRTAEDKELRLDVNQWKSHICSHVQYCSSSSSSCSRHLHFFFLFSPHSTEEKILKWMISPLSLSLPLALYLLPLTLFSFYFVFRSNISSSSSSSNSRSKLAA